MGKEWRRGAPGLHGVSAQLGEDRNFHEHLPTFCAVFDVLMADLILSTSCVRLREVKWLAWCHRSLVAGQGSAWSSVGPEPTPSPGSI